MHAFMAELRADWGLAVGWEKVELVGVGAIAAITFCSSFRGHE